MNLPLLFSLIAFSSIFSIGSAIGETKRALLFGGSGEDHKPENFLKPGFEQFEKNLKKRNWEVTTLFDGSRHAIEVKKSATQAEIRNQLKRLSNESLPGDEVLLYFNGHGTQSPHRLLTEDPEAMTLYDINRAAFELSQKGVKVAVVDLSCFSGTTQPIAKNRYCTVTLAAPDYTSICGTTPDPKKGFTNAFINPEGPVNLPVNLEDHFLRSRLLDDSSVNFPQISSIETPNLKEWNDILKYTDSASVLSDFSLIGSQALGPDECKTEESGRRAMRAFITDFLKIRSFKRMEDKKELPAELIEALGHLSQKLQERDTRAEKLQETLDTKGPWAENVPDFGLGELNTIIELLNGSFPIENIAWLSPELKQKIKDLTPRKEELVQKHKKLLASVQEDWKAYEQSKTALEAATQAALKQERLYYQKKYEDDLRDQARWETPFASRASSSADTKPVANERKNPCKNFVL